MYVHELLDLVGAIGAKPSELEDAVRHLYDWHNGRSVAGMQLTFAPAAAAILAIVAKPNSTVVIVGASAVLLVMLVLGGAQLLALNWLHGEYVFAVRLAAELRAFRAELELYPHGAGAPAGSTVSALYETIGPVSMVEYRADPESRKRVLGVLSECGGLKGGSP